MTETHSIKQTALPPPVDGAFSLCVFPPSSGDGVCVCVCVREEALSEIMMMHSSYTEIGSAVLS